MKTSTFLKLVLLGIFVMLYGTIFSKPVLNIKHGDKDIKDSSICLEIKGRLSKARHKTKNLFLVELLLDNTVIASVTEKDGDSFKFFMKKNNWYTVKILEEGREPKLLLFDTHIPEIYTNYIYVLSFEVDDLLTDDEAQKLDPDAIDFPIALFDFDKRFDEFNFNEEYRTNILKTLFEPIIASHY